MEKELHNDEFWGFLTNSETDSYPTRIDLVLDLISKKTEADKETYRTFFYFYICNFMSDENIAPVRKISKPQSANRRCKISNTALPA
jgi:hypothetical protein